ncbi:MAG: hypothetical protein KAY24_00375 [Candidatus Eisenbacteria sp.]|nr:hypothetical protein [Candidatus Eisenbacteria bacterium]
MSQRLRDAEAEYIRASSAINRSFGPTQEQWDEFDAAVAECKAAEESEKEEEEGERWTLLVYEPREKA